MATLVEQEIITYLNRLDSYKQQQVLAYVRELVADTIQKKINADEWLASAKALTDELQLKYGENFRVDVQGLLDEVREERLDDLLRGS